MDAVSVATDLITGQTSVERGAIIATVINEEQNRDQEMVSVLGDATRAASGYTPEGTGSLLNVYA
jgi:hypothetical protein